MKRVVHQREQWLKPSLDLGRGPTRSRWMWESCLARIGICWTEARGWRVTLACWQNWQFLEQGVMSVDMPVHTHLTDTRRLVGQSVDGSECRILEWRREQQAGCSS